MAISCAWIIWEAVERVLHHAGEIHHSVWPVLVLLTSIAVDFWRSRQLRCCSQTYRLTCPRNRRISLRQRYLGYSGRAGRALRQLGRHAFPYPMARAMPIPLRQSWFLS